MRRGGEDMVYGAQRLRQNKFKFVVALLANGVGYLRAQSALVLWLFIHVTTGTTGFMAVRH